MNAKKKALKETAAKQMPEKEQEVIYIDDLFNKKTDNTYVTLPDTSTEAKNTDEVMKAAKKRLNLEGWIQALLSGGIVALLAAFAVSMVFWAIGASKYWIAFIVLGAVFAAATPIFFFCKYRPDEKTVAKRLDELGLDERVLTMEELKGNDSFMAKRQRTDAVRSLGKVKASLLKIVASVPLIILCTTAFILGGGMTTVSGLTAAGYVKSGKDIAQDIDDANKPVYEVKYSVEAREASQEDSFFGGFSIMFDVHKGVGGEIIGEEEQLVTQGEDATEVTVVEYEGYVFYAWSDGVQSPTRTDLNVQGDISITAIFVKMDENEDSDGNGDGDPSDGEPSEKEPGDKEPSDNNSDGNGKDDTNLDNTASTDSRNQVLNGKTYYGGKNYDEAKSEASDKASKDGNMSSDKKNLINDYFEAIKKN